MTLDTASLKSKWKENLVLFRSSSFASACTHGTRRYRGFLADDLDQNDQFRLFRGSFPFLFFAPSIPQTKKGRSPRQRKLMRPPLRREGCGGKRDHQTDPEHGQHFHFFSHANARDPNPKESLSGFEGLEFRTFEKGGAEGWAGRGKNKVPKAAVVSETEMSLS